MDLVGGEQLALSVPLYGRLLASASAVGSQSIAKTAIQSGLARFDGGGRRICPSCEAPRIAVDQPRL